MMKLNPWKQCTLSCTRKTALYMFLNCHANFRNCSSMTRNSTPIIQEVNDQPVYLLDGMEPMAWTQLQWIWGQVSLHITLSCNSGPTTKCGHFSVSRFYKRKMLQNILNFSIALVHVSGNTNFRKPWNVAGSWLLLTSLFSELNVKMILWSSWFLLLPFKLTVQCKHITGH